LLEIRLGNVYTDNMAGNANSVNIKNYHHGDLRSAVVAEGLRLLQDREADSLSLREIARNVGVSATALYRHFPDKASLLVALADAGYAMLAQEQLAAVHGDGPERFAALGRAYVRFALAHPALFRLIFVNSPVHMHARSVAPSGSAASLLEQVVAQIMGPDATPEARFAVMLRAWSLVHGLSMLILDKQVLADDALIDQVVSSTSVGLESPL
jgi:AcrR family transcriptional regulator